MSKKIKVVHISSEVSPFSKTGGLADVARSLPKALKRLGHEVLVITPFYGKIIDKTALNLRLVFPDVKIKLSDHLTVTANFWRGYLMDDLSVYFVEIPVYFSKMKRLYGSANENERFFAFDVAALRLLELLDCHPQIIHCHDWQTGLIPYLIKKRPTYRNFFEGTKTVYTIHNLIFQLGHNWWEIPPQFKDFGRKKLPIISDPLFESVNFAKRAILTADIVNTVSENYRQEIMTKKFGQDLHRILRRRETTLFGIINGIDYNSYNPGNDSTLPVKYTYQTFLPAKKAAKQYLQPLLNWPVNADTPLLCTTSRVTYQKGFNLILKILPALFRFDIQMLFLGDGTAEYINSLKKMQLKYPKKIIWKPFDEKLETLAYAASDFFLLPSNHEPCGINQLIAMRYGCIPIVREVGGLYDTVENFSPATKRGTGFTFKNEDEWQLFAAIMRALENQKNRVLWELLVKRVMRRSNSWEIPARKYVELYKKAIRL
jgi:starch synthase